MAAARREAANATTETASLRSQLEGAHDAKTRAAGACANALISAGRAAAAEASVNTLSDALRVAEAARGSALASAAESALRENRALSRSVESEAAANRYRVDSEDLAVLLALRDEERAALSAFLVARGGREDVERVNEFVTTALLEMEGGEGAKRATLASPMISSSNFLLQQPVLYTQFFPSLPSLPSPLLLRPRH